MIQALHRQGYLLRRIASEVICAHATVFYEPWRGTSEKKESRSRVLKYTAKHGEKAYEEHRKNSRKPCKIYHDNYEPHLVIGVVMRINAIL